MTQTLSGTVAANIRAEAARRRKTQAQLAEAAGLSQFAISRRMREEFPFTLDEVQAIADFLGVPLSDLLNTAA